MYLKINCGIIFVETNKKVVTKFPWCVFKNQLMLEELNWLLLVEYTIRLSKRHKNYILYLILDMNQIYCEFISST